jgi:DNA-binding LacI/PurR family transcriptional regulator
LTAARRVIEYKGGMPNPVTLQTIADALGVSRTTVSNAYNRPDQLAPELRERVLEKARELGYSGPDPAARRLRSGRRDVVGLLLTEQLSYAFTDPAAVTLLEGIARATEQAGLALLLIPEHGPGVGNAVQDAVVDAFCIYSMPAGHPNVMAALERRLPMVVVGEPKLDGHTFVAIEDRRGARLAAEHLIDLGHRRLGIVHERTRDDGYAGPLTPERELNQLYDDTRERLAGYREALEAAGIDWRTTAKYEVNRNLLERGLEGGRALLTAADRPTAMLASTDLLALGALEAARELGLEVPRDVSVVGFDDVPGAAWSRPPLTTVHQPLLEKGEVAGRMLIAACPDREVVLPVELIVRGTTAPPP